jgi:acyl-CoA thioester hydrolase
MFKSITQVRVRYGETDRMGYVYYGNYPLYYEVGRVEALRALGLSYQKMEDDLMVFMPVMSLQVKYVRPCFYDELLNLETSIPHLPGDTIQFNTDIIKSDGKLANRGLVTLCFVDKNTNKRVPVPKQIMDVLQEYYI